MLNELEQRLLDNQLLLHARTRGPRIDRPGAICFEASAPSQRYWLLARWIEVPPGLRDVRILPGAEVRDAELRAAGFTSDGVLRYLWTKTPERTPEIPTPDGLSIAACSGPDRSAGRETFLRAFSEVMTRGFESRTRGVVSVEQTLQRYRAGAENTDETYYLARVHGVPAAVARTFCADGLLGIYGVATMPAFQRRGIAAALLAAALDEARARGAERVTLQTWADSAPERLYRRLGFVPAFDVGLWVRPRPPTGGERGR